MSVNGAQTEVLHACVEKTFTSHNNNAEKLLTNC